ncbi:MAG: ferrochelatase [Acidimicrobiales bacterium]
MDVTPPAAYDAILVLSFGGPEGPEDVVPFLENVTRGRGIPPERLVEVGAHYSLFGGVSPINAANRALIAALETELAARGPHLPVYWGNRNWHPLLADTLRQMRDDGVRHAACFVTSAFSSYSSCRQYRDDIVAARDEVGDGAPIVDKLRPFFDHPGFITPMTANVTAALETLEPALRAGAHLAFTAHSIPSAQAATCDYEIQLREASRLVADAVGGDRSWEVVYQSRSGPPGQPWLEPDIGDHLETLHAGGVAAVVMVPIGFVSDHVEVIYDLDIQASARARALGLTVTRAATVGTAAPFVAMIPELIAERSEGAPQRRLGALAPRPLSCVPGCCPPPARRAA